MCESDSTRVYVSRDKGRVVPQNTMKPYDKMEVEFISFFKKALTLNKTNYPCKMSLGTHSIWGCVAVTASYEEKINILHLSGMELGSSFVQSVD
jgi:hypothetical protein